MLRRAGSPRDLERVPNAVNGADEFRTELAAQRLHVGVDGPPLPAGAPAPYVFEQSVAGNRRAGPACQEDEQIEFGSRSGPLVVTLVNPGACRSSRRSPPH